MISYRSASTSYLVVSSMRWADVDSGTDERPATSPSRSFES